MRKSRRHIQRNGIDIVGLISLRINSFWCAYQAVAAYRCRSLKGFETGIAFLIVRIICVINEHWLQ
jgi:hypothetical protein